MTQEKAGPPIPTDWEGIIAAFESHLVQQGRAQTSVVVYSLAVRKFGDFYLRELKKTGPYVTRLKASDFQAFIKHAETSRYLSRSSLNQSVSALRSFTRFLLRENWLRVDIAQGLRTKFTGRRGPTRRLSPKESRSLMDSVPLCCREVERDRAILQLMLQSGLRISEIVNLSVGDIQKDDNAGQIRVRGGHGTHARVVALTRSAHKALKDYLSLRGPVGKEDLVFISNRGQKLSPKSIQYLTKKYLCVIHRPELSADDLRHEYALRLYEKTGDLRVVQEALGHRNRATTARYVRTDG